jgi:hypothetical protein
MLHHLDLSKVEWELVILSGPKGPLPPPEEQGAAKENANRHRLIIKYIIHAASFMDKEKSVL